MTDNKKVSPMAAYPICATDFDSKEAQRVNKLIDFYEDRQMKHLIDSLDGKGGYGKRHDWKARGVPPHTRNITKSIVDKSGLLFNKPPKLTIAIKNELNAVTDDVFNEIMESADWLEIFQNVDVYTRLTKSTILLQQKYIPTDTVTVNGQYKFDQGNGDALLFTILHQGNSVVKMNPQRTLITALAFLTDVDNDGDEHGPFTSGVDNTKTDSTKNWSYRLITAEEIIDVLVESGETSASEQIETIVSRQPNPDGFVPASFFYDINKPRTGYWGSFPESLMSFQERINSFLTDQAFGMAFQIQKTAFITGKIKNDDQNQGNQVIPYAPQGHTTPGQAWNDIPAFQQKTQTTLGGLGAMIRLEGDMNGSQPSVDFVGPDTDLKSLQDIIGTMVEDIANDWDCNLKYGGGGSATSGFQLVVEENNNLTLRDKRAQSMVAGFRRMYQITQKLYVGQITEGMLQVEFAPPSLPVNQEEVERIWSDRIDNNRASMVDYFQEVKGMTEAQAIAKVAKVITENNAANKAIVPAVPAAPPAPTMGQAADKTLVPVRNDLNNG